MTARPSIDWLNPCERADALRQSYFALLSGQRTSSVAYTANGVSREVRYAQGDLARLETEWRAAEQECEGTTGRRITTIKLQTSKGIGT